MDEYCSGFEGQGKDMGTDREIRAPTAYIPFPLITRTDGQSGRSKGAEGQGDFFGLSCFFRLLPRPSSGQHAHPLVLLYYHYCTLLLQSSGGAQGRREE